MDTSERISVETPNRITRRRRSVEEKRRIVEETLEAGASAARVARRHAVNANQVFYWRKKYREGRLSKGRSSNLLPVAVSEIRRINLDKYVVSRRDAVWGRWKSNCRRGKFASRAVSKQKHCAPCWNVCSDDRAAGGNAHLDRGGSYRSAARFHGTERDGADGSPGESVFRTCVCVSWTAGRSDQDVVVGRRWAVSFREAARTWTLHLAASDKWNSVAYTSPVIDVAGRDRLAATGTHANAAAGGVSRNYQQLICHEFSCLAYCAQDE